MDPLETSFSHLISTNDPPNIQETLDVRTIVSSMERKLAEHEDQIRQLKVRLNSYRRILSPCRRVPPEILGEIFLQLWTGKSATKDQKALLACCRVCKKWRDAAYQLPHLWKAVTIDLDHIRSQCRWYHPIDSWLRRSGTMPKELNIQGSLCGPPISDGRKSCMVDSCRFSTPDVVSILKSGPPLGRLSIIPPTSHCWSRLMTEVDGVHNRHTPLGSIKTLLLSADSWRDWVQTPSKPFLPSMPALTDLAIRLPRVRDIDHGADLATFQLTIPADMRNRLVNLGLAFDWSARHTLPILQQCSNIEVLALNLGGGVFGEQSDGDPLMLQFTQQGITLPRVRKVVLLDLPHSGLRNLRILSLPTQEETFVLFSGASKDNLINEDHASYLAEFLRGGRTSPPTIHSLSIHNGVFPENTLLDVLRDLSSLQRLALSDIVTDDNFFHKLKASTLLPELHTLDIVNVSVGGDLDGLTTFIEERGITLTRV